MKAEEYLKKKGMSNVGHYGLLIVDTSKSKMHQIMEDYAEQQIKELKEQAKVYGRHQFNRGSLKLDLVPFDDWKSSDTAKQALNNK